MRFVVIIMWVAVAVVLLLPLLRRLRVSSRKSPRALPDELVKDPVCQTYIVKSRAVQRTDGDRIRYFCSEQCARLASGG